METRSREVETVVTVRWPFDPWIEKVIRTRRPGGTIQFRCKGIAVEVIHSHRGFVVEAPHTKRKRTGRLRVPSNVARAVYRALVTKLNHRHHEKRNQKTRRVRWARR